MTDDPRIEAVRLGPTVSDEVVDLINPHREILPDGKWCGGIDGHHREGCSLVTDPVMTFRVAVEDPRIQAVLRADVLHDRAPSESLAAEGHRWAEKILAAADAADPLRQPGMVRVDTRDEAVVERVMEILLDHGTHYAARAAHAVLAALRGEQ